VVFATHELEDAGLARLNVGGAPSRGIGAAADLTGANTGASGAFRTYSPCKQPVLPHVSKTGVAGSSPAGPVALSVGERIPEQAFTTRVRLKVRRPESAGIRPGSGAIGAHVARTLGFLSADKSASDDS
jgi:hypothetical protein